MSDLIDRQALRAAHGLGSDCHDCKRDMKSCQYDRDYSLMDFCEWLDDAPTASPWHRVEEPPKEHGKYPVCWVENGNFYWQEAHYCYYQDGDKWVAWSSFQGDDVEITPDYWMPIEPPKEDA